MPHALLHHLDLMNSTLRLFVHYSVSWMPILNNGHDWLLIAGNLRISGSHHKTISHQCVTNDVELSDHHRQLLGNQLIIANRQKFAGKEKTNSGTMSTEQYEAMSHRKE